MLMNERPYLDAKSLVGVIHIDREHQKLFQILGQVHDAHSSGDSSAKQTIRSAVVELLDYTRTHFASEEATMETSGYPALAAHRELHGNLLAQVRDFEIRAEFDEQFGPVELATFLYNWLATHIRGADKAFGDYYRNTRKAASSKFAPILDGDFSKYEVESRTERLFILKGLHEIGSQITFHFNHGYDFVLTSLIDISADGRSLVFDYGSSMEMNRKLLQSDSISCITTKDKVRIQFILPGVESVEHEGRDAFRSGLPDSLIRLQRREFYRVSTPKATAIMASIPLPPIDRSARTLQAVVVDISGGGIGLKLPPDDVSLKVDTQFMGVSIDLPNVGMVSVDLRVRNLYEVTLANGKIQQRAGCEFVKLPGAVMKLIQRYIMQTERERKARED